jgi:hypothetical protein
MYACAFLTLSGDVMKAEIESPPAVSGGTDAAAVAAAALAKCSLLAPPKGMHAMFCSSVLLSLSIAMRHRSIAPWLLGPPAVGERSQSTGPLPGCCGELRKLIARLGEGWNRETDAKVRGEKGAWPGEAPSTATGFERPTGAALSCPMPLLMLPGSDARLLQGR